MNASKVVLAGSDTDEMLLLDIQVLDRDGGALFTVLQTAVLSPEPVRKCSGPVLGVPFSNDLGR